MNDLAGKIPKTWEQLRETFYCLRPIHNEQEYDRVLEIAGALAAHENLNDDQQDYLETLSMLLEHYEKLHYEIDTSDIEPVEILRTLMEENGMNASDLGRLLGDRALGCRILNGQRQLSKQHIMTLSKHFNVSPALFFSNHTTNNTGNGCNERKLKYK